MSAKTWGTLDTRNVSPRDALKEAHAAIGRAQALLAAMNVGARVGGQGAEA